MVKKKKKDEDYVTISITLKPSQLKRIDEACLFSHYRARSAFIAHASLVEAERELRKNKSIIE